jgi:hypothetical protein
MLVENGYMKLDNWVQNGAGNIPDTLRYALFLGHVNWVCK